METLLPIVDWFAGVIVLPLWSIARRTTGTEPVKSHIANITTGTTAFRATPSELPAGMVTFFGMCPQAMMSGMSPDSPNGSWPRFGGGPASGFAKPELIVTV